MNQDTHMHQHVSNKNSYSDDGDNAESIAVEDIVSSQDTQESTVESITNHKEMDLIQKEDNSIQKVILSVEGLQKLLENASNSEAKLNLSLDFMEKILSQKGTPHFRLFWEVRRMCGDLFKEEIEQSSRTVLWKKYSEISKEMRKLKDILDEQSNFAVEQIEIAIKSLEVDVDNFEVSLEKIPVPDFSAMGKILANKLELYRLLQRELNLLNVQASRISALRKGLIKTEMRIKHKNQFFHRLSAVGDKVFPLRKERIKGISQHFVEDIDAFIQNYFSQNSSLENLSFLREEIKSLQNLAKILTLNTQAFTHTRTHLSECWDKIRHIEKERKKERSQQRAIFKQHCEVFHQEIEAFTIAFREGTLSMSQAQKTIDEITQKMRNTELGRDELKFLQPLLQQARSLVLEKAKAEEQQRQDQEDAKMQHRKEKMMHLKQRIANLIINENDYDTEAFISEKDAIQEEIQGLLLAKGEKQELEKLMKPLRDVIHDKKENALLALSDDDREALQQLYAVLKQRKERRQEIKNQLEIYRKNSSVSGLDFEQAISYTEQINIEKQRLEKINEGILEVEHRIASLRGK